MLGTIVVYLLLALMLGLVIAWGYELWEHREKRSKDAQEHRQRPPAAP